MEEKLEKYEDAELENFVLDRKKDRKHMTGIVESVKDKMPSIHGFKDYKTTWTLIHGSAPILKEDYLYFHQIDKPLNQHPNFLHFQIKEFLEELDYIIVSDARPLPLEFEVKSGCMVVFNCSGYLSASIECKREVLKEDSKHSRREFLKKAIKPSDTVKGHTKIYVKEEGICYYSKDFEPPYLKGNIRIVFAGSIKQMNKEELMRDIEKLNGKILEFLETPLPI